MDTLEMKNVTGDRDGSRQYVRTSDNIPIFYDEAGDGSPDIVLDWENLFNDIDPGPNDNPKLYELLFDINQKLNILIRHISEKNGFNMPEAKEVNISGGGLRFFSKDPFPEGSRLILKAFLPTGAHVIKIKCEVVRSYPKENGYEVAVKYVDMDEATRDKIIKYVFARQRELLRSEKE